MCTHTHTQRGNTEATAPWSPRFNTVKGFGFIEPLGEATAILEGKAAWAKGCLWGLHGLGVGV